jgi:hypothetical protein
MTGCAASQFPLVYQCENRPYVNAPVKWWSGVKCCIGGRVNIPPLSLVNRSQIIRHHHSANALISKCLFQNMAPRHIYPWNRPWRPIGLWDVENPTLYRHTANRWRLQCQHYAPAALCSPEALFFCFWCSFLLEAERNRSAEKNSMTSLGLDPATFQLVTWRLNQLCCQVPVTL